MKPSVDPCRGNPWARTLRGQLETGNCRDTQAFLESLREPQLRDFFVDVSSSASSSGQPTSGASSSQRPASLSSTRAALPLDVLVRHAFARHLGFLERAEAEHPPRVGAWGEPPVARAVTHEPLEALAAGDEDGSGAHVLDRPESLHGH